MYLAEGDYLNAKLSFVGVIPVLGEAATGSRFAIRGARRGGKFLHSAENAGSGISRLSRARNVTKAADTVDSEAATGLRAVTHGGQDLQAGVTGYERGSTTISGVTHGGQDLQAGAVRTTKPSTSCLNSFPGSTLVLLGNGTTTRIDHIRIGDWVDATNLHTGDQLRQPNGHTTTITTVTDHPDTTTTYNLTINALHTYYVLAGHSPVLVHNCGELGSGNAYSVAYESQLPSSAYPGRSRAHHFQQANADLVQAMDSDPGFASAMDDLIPGVHGMLIGPRGGISRRSPTGWTWHHAAEPGVMRLVPRIQHQASGPLQELFNSGGVGGFKIWG